MSLLELAHVQKNQANGLDPVLYWGRPKGELRREAVCSDRTDD